MNITKIEIHNIKGIGRRSFQFDILPNKPNILVAPNGFGKTSFAIAFKSLKSKRIELEEKYYFNNNAENRPALFITLTTGDVLSADDNQNAISDHFDVFVINNQTEPKSKIQKFNGKPFTRPTLDIVTTTLIQTIPPKADFDYNSAKMKIDFGSNGTRLLENISNLFRNCKLFNRIDNEIDFGKFKSASFLKSFEPSRTQINQQIGTGAAIKAWMNQHIVPTLRNIDELKKLADIIFSFGFQEAQNEVDSYLAAWQIIVVRKNMGNNYKKAYKHLCYIEEKADLTKTIEALNPVRDRFDIRPEVDGNSLVVKWPKAHEISNGQRDILTFIALLLKSRRNLKKNDCILVIDEIFDYMDDANLITFQYYVSNFINEMKRKKRRIFPILLTHLDPLFFNHFCFNDTKINVNYLKHINIKPNKHILNLIYKRDDPKIKTIVDAYFFHFHPSNEGIDLTTAFKNLKLNADWGTPDKFHKKVFREVRRYLYENPTEFDPLAICFGVRTHIERLVYEQIADQNNKQIYIQNTHGTKNKLLFAQSIGIQIPETYFLLGIIYNTSLHLTEGQDISRPLAIKLENDTIKKMIKNIFHK
jgi:hypothetical protein